MQNFDYKISRKRPLARVKCRGAQNKLWKVWRRPAGKPKNRLGEQVWKDAVKLLNTKICMQP
jgi:hypothetical protein